MKRTHTTRLCLFTLGFVGLLFLSCQNRGTERADAELPWPQPLIASEAHWRSEPISNCLTYLDIDPDAIDGVDAEPLASYLQSIHPDVSEHDVSITEEAIETRVHQIESRFPDEQAYTSFLSTIEATPTLLRFAICRDLQLEALLVPESTQRVTQRHIEEQIFETSGAYAAQFESAETRLHNEALQMMLRRRLLDAMLFRYEASRDEISSSALSAIMTIHYRSSLGASFHDRIENSQHMLDNAAARERLRNTYVHYENVLFSTPTYRAWALHIDPVFLEVDHLHLLERDEPQSLVVHSDWVALTLLAPDGVLIEEHPLHPVDHELSLKRHATAGGAEQLHLSRSGIAYRWQTPLSTLAYYHLRYMASEDVWDADASSKSTRTFRCGAHCPEGIATPSVTITLTSEEGHREMLDAALCRVDPEPRYVTIADEDAIQKARENATCDDDTRASLLRRNSPDAVGDLSRAADTYNNQCLVCHGDSGRSDGPAGMALFSGQPRLDLTVPATFKQGSSPLEIFHAIRDGVPDSGMPAYEHLPEDVLWELAHYVNQMSEEDTTAVAPQRFDNLCKEYGLKSALRVLDEPCL